MTSGILGVFRAALAGDAARRQTLHTVTESSSRTHAAGSTLLDYLAESARRRGGHVAVEDLPDGSLTYGELDALADRVRDHLWHAGVRPGDRVGVYTRKSIDAYAAMLGAMKAGAAYVPVDVGAPAWRAAFILADCGVRAVVMERSLVAGWRAEQAAVAELPALLVLDEVGGGRGLSRALDAGGAVPAAMSTAPGPDDLAYILYTSGSTGKPKGVMLTHRAAVAFVEWCSAAFAPREEDRFSSHAPFHFDLSILDLYVPLRHGATVVLIDADRGKEPLGLAQLIAERRLSVWYSTPTILTVLAQFGRMERHDYSALRHVLFAGEVFPVKHLRATKDRLPHPVFHNLYGPTETNVCTYHRIPDHVEEDRTGPYPIGRVCEQLRARVVDADGGDVAHGEEGELVICGDNVMQGYWNLSERTAEAFLLDSAGERWYRTGDVVTEDASGAFTFMGRRDRMMKRRGYRIELGEVEAGLYRHPSVREAAVVAVADADGGVRLRAFVALCEGGKGSVVEMKRFAADVLPAYMIPDLFTFVDALPKTSTDKVDYQRLAGAP